MSPCHPVTDAAVAQPAERRIGSAEALGATPSRGPSALVAQPAEAAALEAAQWTFESSRGHHTTGA
jgi:hypothetical protein